MSDLSVRVKAARAWWNSVLSCTERDEKGQLQVKDKGKFNQLTDDFFLVLGVGSKAPVPATRKSE